MRVVIIEDEVAAQEQLRMLLEQSDEFDIEVVEIIDSIADSINFFTSTRIDGIDLVFMDIHLSDGYAFSIFKHTQITIPIIFTTAYDEYALKSFEVNCLDYILKPLSKSDIERVFSKMRILCQYSRVVESRRFVERLLVMDGWRTVPLPVENIAFLYKEESKVRVYDINGGRYLVNHTLESLEEMLCDDDFIRANRQFILSRTAVKSLESYEGSRAVVELMVKSPERVVISRTKVSQFKRWLAGE